MERKVFEEFKNKSEFSKKFLNCCNNKKYLQTAIFLAKLGIKYDSKLPFEQIVNVNQLEQFENLLLRLGSNNFDEVIGPLEKDKKELKEFLETLEDLRQQKEKLELNEEEMRSKRENIERLEQEMKESIQTIQTGPSNMPITEEKNSYLHAKKKNESLRKELDKLEGKSKGSLEWDLNSNQDLDKLILELGIKYDNIIKSSIKM